MGPRYAAALMLGYYQYSYLVPEATADSLAAPCLANLLIIGSGVLVFLIACAMLVTVFLNVKSGATSIQVERRRRWNAHLRQKAKDGASTKEDWDPRLRLWIPSESSNSGGVISRVDPSLPLFDLGAKENRKRLLGDSWMDWISES